MNGSFCTVYKNVAFRGVFFGDNPFTFDTPRLLAQLSVCALATACVQCILSPFGQSAFISHILAGLILGPALLGRFKPLRDSLFPESSFYIIDTFAFFGVMFFLFIIGVKTDLKLIRKSGKRAAVVGLCAFVVPLLLNTLIGEILIHNIPMEPRLHGSILWIATFQAMSSFHVIVCLLTDLKLLNSELGRLAISSSMVSGSCSWFWTAIVFTGEQGVSIKKHSAFLFMISFLAIMVLFAAFIFRPVIQFMIHRTSNGKSLKESHICAVFVLIMGSALFGDYFGQHFLFGPVILGLVVPDGPPVGSALVSKLELFVSYVVLPVFFVISGARIDFSTISLRNFSIVVLLSSFALVWKVVGVMLPSLYFKIPVGEAVFLGLTLGNQGITEVLILERAQSAALIDKQSYSCMLLSIVMFTGVLAPIIKFCYNPSSRYKAGQWMTIEHSNPYTELRVLACLHYPEQTHSIINLFEASYPHPQDPICFYVVHLLDLAGRSAPVFLAHHPGIRNPSHTESDHIVNALRFFEHENRGYATVYPFTAISPYASMHDDVCNLAAEKRVSLVILLFHKHPLIHISEVEANAIRSVNQNIIEKSPSSVGILVDHGAMNNTGSIMSRAGVCRIGVLFLGGPDDRESLSYACRMAKHPNTCLTVVQLVEDDMRNSCSIDEAQDFSMINEYRAANTMNSRCLYQEERVKDSMGLISAVGSMEVYFDLILVGRRHDNDSPLLAGLNDWNEHPELGCVGDMLLSSDAERKASVLVVQQASADVNVLNSNEPYTGLEMPWNDSRVWPA